MLPVSFRKRIIYVLISLVLKGKQIQVPTPSDSGKLSQAVHHKAGLALSNSGSSADACMRTPASFAARFGFFPISRRIR